MRTAAHVQKIIVTAIRIRQMDAISMSMGMTIITAVPAAMFVRKIRNALQEAVHPYVERGKNFATVYASIFLICT